MKVPPQTRSVVLTPPGAGAIGVVRVIGPGAREVSSLVLRSRSGGRLAVPNDGRLHYCTFRDGNLLIDDVIVSAAPAGEWTAIDICAHGGVRVMERILEALERFGAPIQSSGESAAKVWPAETLIEREALDALTLAKTHRAARFLAWQRSNLPEALGHVAELAGSDLGRARREFEHIAAGYSAARVLLSGATVALVGPPNSGKSTLFNQFVGRSAAIVSPHPGTTRDWVSAEIEFCGIPITLVDTAGQADISDYHAGSAVGAGLEVSSRADLRLLVLDGSRKLSPEGDKLLTRQCRMQPWLMVASKLDLGTAWEWSDLPGNPTAASKRLARVSGRTGVGTERLLQALVARLGVADWTGSQPCLFTTRQQRVGAELLLILENDPTIASEFLNQRLLGESQDDLDV